MSHWQSQAKNRPLDNLYSTYIRAKANWRCERCHLDCSGNHQYLTNSHFHGRRKESVRFDDDNCVSFCRKCHEWAEAHKKTEYKDWMIEHLGEKEFDLLQMKAETPSKSDDFLMKIIVQEKIKGLEENF